MSRTTKHGGHDNSYTDGNVAHDVLISCPSSSSHQPQCRMSTPASLHIAHLFLVGRTLGRAWRWCWRWRQAAMRKPLLRHSACCRAASGQGQGRDAILGVGVMVVERLKSTATPVLGLAASSEEYRRPPANGRDASREIQMASLHHRGAGQGPNVPRGACLFLRWLGPWLQTMNQGPWPRLWAAQARAQTLPPLRQVPDPALDL